MESFFRDVSLSGKGNVHSTVRTQELQHSEDANGKEEGKSSENTISREGVKRGEEVKGSGGEAKGSERPQAWRQPTAMLWSKSGRTASRCPLGSSSTYVFVNVSIRELSRRYNVYNSRNSYEIEQSVCELTTLLWQTLLTTK